MKVCAGALLLVAGVGVWKTYVSSGRVDPKAWVSLKRRSPAARVPEASSPSRFPDGVSGAASPSSRRSTARPTRHDALDDLVRDLSKHGVAYVRTDSADFTPYIAGRGIACHVR